MNLILKISYLYLAVPTVVFLLTWTRYYISLPISFLVFCGYLVLNKISIHYQLPHKRHLLIILILASLWGIMSGSGGFVNQNSDWEKHNAVLADLVNEKWPVYYYDHVVGKTVLTYYSGSYILPALVGKYFGMYFARYYQLFQTILGVALVFTWLHVLAPKAKFLSILLFVSFSTPDIIGSLLNGSQNKLDNWSYFTNPSFTNALFFAPGQTISAWLFVFPIYAFTTKNISLIYLFPMLNLLFFWSPFAGIFSFVLWFFLYLRKIKLTDLFYLSFLSIPILLFLYYKANIFQIVYRDRVGVGFINLDKLSELQLFYFAEVLPLLVVLFFAYKFTKEKILIPLLVALFILSPLIKGGLYNDFFLRGILPITSLFFIFIINHLENKKVAYTFFLLYLLGFYTFASEIKRVFLLKPNARYDRGIQTYSPDFPEISKQYMGFTNSFFYRYILKQ